MKKNVLHGMAIGVVIVTLLFTVSCARKSVGSNPYADATQTNMGGAGSDQGLTKGGGIGESNLNSSASGQQGMGAGAGGYASPEDRFVNEDVYFEFDSTVLSPSAIEVVKAKADWLRDNPGVSVIIEGHCDERGNDEYNLALGDKRAQSVKAFLANVGIDLERLQTVSYGEEHPADPGHSEEAYAKNRRAHFEIKR